MENNKDFGFEVNGLLKSLSASVHLYSSYQLLSSQFKISSFVFEVAVFLLRILCVHHLCTGFLFLK